MRVFKEQAWGLVRTITATAITITALICLMLAGCTNELNPDTENRGTGETLALGTLGITGSYGSDNNPSGQTRADQPVPDVEKWQGFRTGDQLNATISAGTGTSLTRSIGKYEYTGNAWTASTLAYWQRRNGNALCIWRGPLDDATQPGAYNMPLTYETNTTTGYALNAWDGTAYTTDADKWRIMDLLRYSSADTDQPATGLPATASPLSLTLKHSMAQLCVELLPGDGITAEELQTRATVHLLGAASTFIMQADGRPTIYNFEYEQSRQNVHLLKNGATSLSHYALMLPEQTFGTDKPMISIHMGDTHFTYTPATPLTTTENTCHKLVLRVSYTGISALSVTSTGWQEPTVITQPDKEEAATVVAVNKTAGKLMEDNKALKDALDNATKDNPIKLIIMGEINDKDLVDLRASMIKSGGGRPMESFKVSSLSIFARGARTIPNEFCKIENSAGNETLKEVILPDDISTIGESAFEECKELTSIEIPDKVTTIADYAFSGCSKLASVILPKELISIENNAFDACSSLTSIDIPKKVTDIGDSAFQSSGLTSIEIPDNVTTIAGWTFDDCTALTTVILPKGLTSIEDFAFKNSGLTSIEIPDNVTTIAYGAFSGCKALATVTLPKELKIIDYKLFYGCSSLATIKIPQEVTSIETYAFEECGLTSIEIPDNVTTIAYGAFINCKALATVVLSEELNIINGSLFSGCSSLTNINIPEKVTTIESIAFYDCSSLTTVRIPQSVTFIKISAFGNCGTSEDLDIVVSGTNMPKASNAFAPITASTLNLYLPDITTLPEATKTWAGVTWKTICYGLKDGIDTGNLGEMTDTENYHYR